MCAVLCCANVASTMRQGAQFAQCSAEAGVAPGFVRQVAASALRCPPPPHPNSAVLRLHPRRSTCASTATPPRWRRCWSACAWSWRCTRPAPPVGAAAHIVVACCALRCLGCLELALYEAGSRLLAAWIDPLLSCSTVASDLRRCPPFASLLISFDMRPLASSAPPPTSPALHRRLHPAAPRAGGAAPAAVQAGQQGEARLQARRG